jgi:hypothetical protein
MKRVWVLVGVIGAGLLAGCFDERSQGKKSGSGTLFRCHFAGRAALNQGTNATRLQSVDALPETLALRKAVAQKLARAAFDFWKKDLRAGPTGQSALLQPLFDDLMVAENCIEVRGPVGKTETVVAVELPDDRARLWSTNLWQVATALKFSAPRAIEGATGWEAKRDPAPGLFQFVRAGKWVLLGLGHNKPGSLQSFAQQAAQARRPLPALTNHFLEVQADLPGLSHVVPDLRAIQVSGGTFHHGRPGRERPH